MKSIHVALAALSLMTATVSQASEASRFEAPTRSTFSRAAVQSEASRASDAGELRYDEAYPRVMAPTSSQLSRENVVAEIDRSVHAYADQGIDGQPFIGGL